MKNALAEERKIFSADGRLLSQFADVGASHEGLFSCAGEDQNTNRRIVPRVEQGTLQLLDRFAIQGVQNFWTIESNRRDAFFFVVQEIFVAHRCLKTILKVCQNF